MIANECEVGTILSIKLPFLTKQQLVDLGLYHAANALERRGLVLVRKLGFSTPTLSPVPLLCPERGQVPSEREAEMVVEEAQRRARRAPLRNMTLYQATPRARDIWGNATEKHNCCSWSHDYLLGALYLATPPCDRGRWRADAQPINRQLGKFEKVPDVTLVNGQGEPMRFCEIVGASYAALRIIELGEHAAAHGVRITYH